MARVLICLSGLQGAVETVLYASLSMQATCQEVVTSIHWPPLASRALSGKRLSGLQRIAVTANQHRWRNFCLPIRIAIAILAASLCESRVPTQKRGFPMSADVDSTDANAPSPGVILSEVGRRPSQRTCCLAVADAL